MKRPKLIKNWPSFNVDIPVGTIGRQSEFAANCWIFDAPGGQGFVSEFEINDRPELFEWVEICDTCKKEICRLKGCQDGKNTGFDGVWAKACTKSFCHGHDEPRRHRIQSVGSREGRHEIHLRNLTRDELDAVFDVLGVKGGSFD